MIWLKRIGLLILITLIIGAVFIGRFIYKVKVGFTKYETVAHDITVPSDQPAILVISKTTGFRHGEAIDASRPMFDHLGNQNDWFIYQTEDAGIFNAEQLNQFEVVVWNNATGTVLNTEQQKLFKSYLENGGAYVGIHAAGDGSHYRWPWYQNTIICADFSHHPFENQFQSTQVNIRNIPDSTWSIEPSWEHIDEWYVFSNQPTEKGATVMYAIDGEAIDPNGNILWVKGFESGMGKEHPVAWFKDVGKGRAFYTSIGHTRATYTAEPFVRMISHAISWTGRL